MAHTARLGEGLTTACSVSRTGIATGRRRGVTVQASARIVLVMAGLILGLAAAGCGDSGDSIPSTSDQRSMVLTLVSGLQSGYNSSNWGAIQGRVQDPVVADSVVSFFQQLKKLGVSRMKIIPTSIKPMGTEEYAVTMQYYSDRRAFPLYDIYHVEIDGNQANILEKASGIDGATFGDIQWTVTRSTHFTIYHSPYQLLGADRKALADLEYQRGVFIRKFGVKVAPHIAFYLYPTTDLMNKYTRSTRELCGFRPDNIGCANPLVNPPTIHSSIWPTFHEPIHVYQMSLDPPTRHGVRYFAPAFMREGMAVALEDRELDPRRSDYCSYVVYHDLDYCARKALPEVKPTSIMTDYGWYFTAPPGDAYALAGSFVRYLILHRGYRALGTFYRVLAGQPASNVSYYDVAARAAYHTSIGSLLSAWEHALCPHGCRAGR